MKKISQLTFGFSDAENYKRRENKQIFQKFFVQNDYLDALLNPSISFLIGEKGTGKTAYSIFLSNSDYKNHRSTLKFLRETEYHKFVELKRQHNLSLSDYTEIWKTIILLIFAETISSNVNASWFGKGKQRLAEIQEAIDEFYAKAFSPELITALQIVEHLEAAARVLAKHTSPLNALEGELTAGESQTNTIGEQRFQTNLLYIRKRLESALANARFDLNLLMFIDGIDIRPSTIPFDDYLDCIKGLANAVWSLNNDFFAQIRGSRGRMRTILLVRPDIFLKVGLQNPNTKARDNAIVLEWITTYKDHRGSKIFDVVDNMLRSQQEAAAPPGAAWDHYFPFDTPNVKEVFVGVRNSFIWFLRNSLYRPRDIMTYLAIFNKHMPAADRGRLDHFPEAYTERREISNEYADYLLGELRDQLAFYHSQGEFDDFLQFFDFLNGNTRFEYDLFLEAFDNFKQDLASRGRGLPLFMSTANAFLQFLYEMNVISFKEKSEAGETFIHWCFRERTQGKIAPKVKTGLSYEIHYGLVPALNMGQKLRPKGRK
jgi:hypothetical protein